MKTNFKNICLSIVAFATLVSCNKDNDNVDTINQNTDFPESVISYNFPLGTTSIQGQTPISINTAATLKMNTVDPVINYNAITLSSVEHTAENLKVNLSTTDKANNYITIKGYKYELLQFHFHRHSEHNVNGEYGTMEIHFVNKSATGAYAVLGVLVKTGVTNNALQTLFNSSPNTSGINQLTDTFYLNSILPADTGKYYSYSGSLTTPNLDLTTNQGPLTWIVFKNQIEITNTQLNNYTTKYADENFRVIQSLNNRKVYENIR
jgi:carbonic anhydrase